MLYKHDRKVWQWSGRSRVWQPKPVAILCCHLAYQGRTEKHLFFFYFFYYIQFEGPEGTRVTMGAKVWDLKDVNVFCFLSTSVTVMNGLQNGVADPYIKLIPHVRDRVLLWEPLCSQESCNWLIRMVNDFGLVRISQWTSSIQKSIFERKRHSRRNVHFKLKDLTFEIDQGQTWSSCTPQVYKT
jgi:hypothetical protein